MTYLVAPSSYVPISTMVPSCMDLRNSINGATSEKKTKPLYSAITRCLNICDIRLLLILINVLKFMHRSSVLEDNRKHKNELSFYRKAFVYTKLTASRYMLILLSSSLLLSHTNYVCLSKVASSS